MGLLEIVWMNFQLLAVESPLAQGLAEFSEVRKLGMNWRWEERGGWWMCTASPHFVRGRQYEGCSGIPRSASYDLSGGEKTLCGACGRPSRRIYDRKLRQVRDLSAGDTRIYLEIERRRVPLPELRQSEAGEAGVALQQPLLHQALCVLCGPALSDLDDPRRRPRVALGLEHRQGTRPAVHAGAAPKSRAASATRDRHRRGLDPQGAHLPHRGQRSGAAPGGLSIWHSQKRQHAAHLFNKTSRIVLFLGLSKGQLKLHRLVWMQFAPQSHQHSREPVFQ